MSRMLFRTARQFNDEFEWAERYGLRASRGQTCQHWLIHGRCGRRECDTRGYYREWLDHARPWLYPDGRRFILAHNYDWTFDKEIAADSWAAANLLSWAVLGPDGWYGSGTTPVRFWHEKGYMHRFSLHLRPASIWFNGRQWRDAIPVPPARA